MDTTIAPILHPAVRPMPDVESATDAYAQRFAGRTGAYLLEVQRKATLRLLEPWRGGTVLDVGGGHAQLAQPLVQEGYRVTILSSSAEACHRPRQLLGDRVELIVGDLLDPPVHDASYDVAISFRILPHIGDWERLIAGLCRVARHAVIVDFPIPGGFNALTPLFSLKQRVEGNTRRYDTFAPHDVSRAFIRAGFRSDATYAQFFLPMVLHRVLRMPRLSCCAEAYCRALGLTRRWGSPIIMRAVAQRD